MTTLSPDPKALIFDVFGTVVDWQTTVLDALRNAAANSICNNRNLSKDVRATASDMIKPDWDEFTREWHTTYMNFVVALANDSNIPWKTVDQHYHDSLRDLLIKWKLDGLWTDQEVLNLSLIWHELDPYKDSKPGLELLSERFKTSTLSNGNATLLKDLVAHGNLSFTHIISAEEFKTYKPNPKTYLGAAERLDCKPEECVMVAAHLRDLEAAKKCGLHTIYIARPREEACSPDEIAHIRKSGSIDIWVEENENGLLSVAKYLGVDQV